MFGSTVIHSLKFRDIAICPWRRRLYLSFTIITALQRGAAVGCLPWHLCQLTSVIVVVATHFAYNSLACKLCAGKQKKKQ